MAKIKLIITDFDGTLVDTFAANFNAYKDAFESVGEKLTEETYRACFGYRFDKFMEAVGIEDKDKKNQIREKKREYYPTHFDLLIPNEPLINFLRAFKGWGGKIAVASTAARKNLRNALRYIGMEDEFDLILAGEDVLHGKPEPEIYNKVMRFFDATPEETLIFEDSPVGFQAAESAAANYIAISMDSHHGGGPFQGR